MKKLYLLLIAAMAFVACDNKEPAPESSLKLLGDQSTELHFEGWADFESITFDAPVNWMIIIDDNSEWFKVTPLYGEATITARQSARVALQSLRVTSA